MLDITIGLTLLILAVVTLVVLVLWSRRRIERIARGNGRSAREIDRELRGD